MQIAKIYLCISKWQLVRAQQGHEPCQAHLWLHHCITDNQTNYCTLFFDKVLSPGQQLYKTANRLIPCLTDLLSHSHQQNIHGYSVLFSIPFTYLCMCYYLSNDKNKLKIQV